jgi:hypothetical protein
MAEMTSYLGVSKSVAVKLAICWKWVCSENSSLCKGIKVCHHTLAPALALSGQMWLWEWDRKPHPTSQL